MVWWQRVPDLDRRWEELGEEGLPRPIGSSYGLRNFWEYVAVTVPHWYRDKERLRASDPGAYAAIEMYGLAAD